MQGGYGCPGQVHLAIPTPRALSHTYVQRGWPEPQDPQTQLVPGQFTTILLPRVSHLESGCNPLDSGTTQGHRTSETLAPETVAFLIFPCRPMFAFTVMTSRLKMRPEKELSSTPQLRKQLGKQGPERQ